MKYILSLAFLAVTISLNAQINDNYTLYGSRDDSLNHKLQSAKKMVAAGKTATFIGLGVMIVGGVVASTTVDDYGSPRDTRPGIIAGSIIAGAGLIPFLTGIPVWTIGATHKKKIQLEMVKYRNPGYASVPGVGLRIMF